MTKRKYEFGDSPPPKREAYGAYPHENQNILHLTGVHKSKSAYVCITQNDKALGEQALKENNLLTLPPDFDSSYLCERSPPQPVAKTTTLKELKVLVCRKALEEDEFYKDYFEKYDFHLDQIRTYCLNSQTDINALFNHLKKLYSIFKEHHVDTDKILYFCLKLRRDIKLLLRHLNRKFVKCMWMRFDKRLNQRAVVVLKRLEDERNLNVVHTKKHGMESILLKQCVVRLERLPASLLTERSSRNKQLARTTQDEAYQNFESTDSDESEVGANEAKEMEIKNKDPTTSSLEYNINTKQSLCVKRILQEDESIYRMRSIECTQNEEIAIKQKTKKGIPKATDADSCYIGFSLSVKANNTNLDEMVLNRYSNERNASQIIDITDADESTNSRKRAKRESEIDTEKSLINSKRNRVKDIIDVGESPNSSKGVEIRGDDGNESQSLISRRTSNWNGSQKNDSETGTKSAVNRDDESLDTRSKTKRGTDTYTEDRESPISYKQRVVKDTEIGKKYTCKRKIALVIEKTVESITKENTHPDSCYFSSSLSAEAKSTNGDEMMCNKLVAERNDSQTIDSNDTDETTNSWKKAKKGTETGIEEALMYIKDDGIKDKESYENETSIQVKNIDIDESLNSSKRTKIGGEADGSENQSLICRVTSAWKGTQENDNETDTKSAASKDNDISLDSRNETEIATGTEQGKSTISYSSNVMNISEMVENETGLRRTDRRKLVIVKEKSEERITEENNQVDSSYTRPLSAKTNGDEIICSKNLHEGINFQIVDNNESTNSQKEHERGAKPYKDELLVNNESDDIKGNETGETVSDSFDVQESPNSITETEIGTNRDGGESQSVLSHEASNWESTDENNSETVTKSAASWNDDESEREAETGREKRDSLKSYKESGVEIQTSSTNLDKMMRNKYLNEGINSQIVDSNDIDESTNSQKERGVETDKDELLVNNKNDDMKHTETNKKETGKIISDSFDVDESLNALTEAEIEAKACNDESYGISNENDTGLNGSETCTEGTICIEDDGSLNSQNVAENGTETNTDERESLLSEKNEISEGLCFSFETPVVTETELNSLIHSNFQTYSDQSYHPSLSEKQDLELEFELFKQQCKRHAEEDRRVRFAEKQNYLSMDCSQLVGFLCRKQWVERAENSPNFQENEFPPLIAAEFDNNKNKKLSYFYEFGLLS